MRRLLLLAMCLALSAHEAAAWTRIKDISSILGLRDNQLVGYGLVVGLQGTGDSMRNAPFTEASLQAMLDRMGVNVTDDSLRIRNVASVMVTANLPPFSTVGTRIDVNISSIGDAVSLQGGILLMTPLSGGDGLVYSVAQGPIAVSGFAAAGAASSISQGVPTDGRIPNGALVEREVPGSLADLKSLVIELHNPDFVTATLVADSINAFSVDQYGRPVARERDMRSIALEKPPGVSTTRFLAEVGELPIQPDAPARVVINERTGTVVIGQDVQISTVAVTQGNLTVTVTEMPDVSQPAPKSRGKTVVVPRTEVTASQQDGHIAIVKGTSLRVLVDGLNKIGLKPTDIIAVLQAIKTAGALQAELVVQ